MAAPIMHFEIHATDPDRARAFYRDAFGWTDMAAPGMDEAYWLLTPTAEDPTKVAGTGPSMGIGGGMLIRHGAPPQPGAAINAYVCILTVEDLDASMAAVTEHGGQIAEPPADIPGVGRIFYGRDTEGNIFGVLQPSTA